MPFRNNVSSALCLLLLVLPWVPVAVKASSLFPGPGNTVGVLHETPLTISAHNTNISCYGAVNGVIRIQAEGGSAPYKYSNNNGLSWQSSPEFRNVSAGLYQLAVEDGDGCIARLQTQLTEPPNLSLRSASAVFQSATDCSVTMTPSGGTPPYSFSIDKGKTWQTSPTFAHIATGFYSIRVKDNNGCGNSIVVTLDISSPLPMLVDTWGASCYGAANGGLIARPQAGTPPFRYSVDNGHSWQTQNTFLLPAGVYTILAEDQSGLRGSARTGITAPAPITASAQVSPVSCHDAADGIITAIAGGGAGSYKYSINSGKNWQTQPSFEGLAGGNYTLLVRDINNCGASVPVQLQTPAPLQVDINTTPLNCNGAATGRIEVSSTGGTPPYQYSADKGLHWQSSAIFGQLPAGDYQVVVKDARGCMYSTSVQISAPPPIAFTAGIRAVSCYGLADAGITITAEGGVSPYRYSINGTQWQNEAQFNGLAAGRFNVMVTDANGCTRQSEVHITQPASLDLELTAVANACSGTVGQIQVNAKGGTLPYRYSNADNNNELSPDGLFSNLPAGDYRLMVSDRNGCSSTLPPIRIAASPALYLNMNGKTDMPCDGIHKGGITLEAEGGIYPYRYELNGRVISPGNITGLEKGSYTAVVTDQLGCKVSRQFDILLQNENCELTMPNGFSPNGDGRNDIFRPALYSNIRQYQLQVFNSWGNLVFACNDPATGWDGAFKGAQQPVGTYVWMVKYTDDKGETKIRRGAVTIVR